MGVAPQSSCCLAVVLKLYLLREYQLLALVYIRIGSRLAGQGVVYVYLAVGCGTEDDVVAVVAGQRIEVGKLFVHGAYTCARLVHLAAKIAHRVAAVHLAEGAILSVLQSLRAYLIVWHGIDKVLDVCSVVVEELLAVGIVKIKLVALDYVVAHSHTLVEFVVDGSGSIIVGYIGACVHTPVDV